MPQLAYYLEMARRIRLTKTTPNILNYLKYRMQQRRPKVSVKRCAPQIGSLVVTMRCNLNCGYCFPAKVLEDAKGHWQENEATLEKVRKIMQNPLFAKVVLVDLMGGEPLLVKDLDAIVAYLTENGHLTNTSTNGLLLADRIGDLKRAGISRINVSLYDKNRTILERDLAKVNAIFPVHASLVLLRSAVEESPEKVLDTIRFVKAAGCLSLRFFMYRLGGMNPQPDQIIRDGDPAYIAFRRRVDEAFPGYCLWPPAVPSAHPQKLCAQLWQRVSCDMSGHLGICCGVDTLLPDPGSNLYEGPPDVIFNHPLLVDMRTQLLDPSCPPPQACRYCNLLEDKGW